MLRGKWSFGWVKGKSRGCGAMGDDKNDNGRAQEIQEARIMGKMGKFEIC